MVVQKINSKKKSTYENDHIKNTNHSGGDEGIYVIIVKLQWSIEILLVQMCVSYSQCWIKLNFRKGRV